MMTSQKLNGIGIVGDFDSLAQSHCVTLKFPQKAINNQCAIGIVLEVPSPIQRRGETPFR